MAWRLCLLAGLGLAATIPTAEAQGVGFLTENERRASYCAGVSEARLREVGEFLKAQCADSNRKECREASDALETARIRDHRLWDYLTRQIFTSRDQGKREKRLAETAIAKGTGDWLACKRRDFGKPAHDLLVWRDSEGCLIDARFGFLDP
ncbi:MAG TPA: hypothetical protein VLA02_16720 [Reyranella sp.]|nr:hypothetical protein [Reyranella sp.]